MDAPLWVAIPVIVLVVLATRADVQTRKIPNSLTGPALLLGVATHFAISGPAGAGNALIGSLVAGGLLLPGWLLGFMGAGDVKLMAAVGAWLGYPQSLMATLITLVAGGVIAVAVAARRGVLVTTLRNTVKLGLWMVRRRAGFAKPVLDGAGTRFPFAPAILAGAIFVLWRQL